MFSSLVAVDLYPTPEFTCQINFTCVISPLEKMWKFSVSFNKQRCVYEGCSHLTFCFNATTPLL